MGGSVGVCALTCAGMCLLNRLRCLHCGFVWDIPGWYPNEEETCWNYVRLYDEACGNYNCVLLNPQYGLSCSFCDPKKCGVVYRDVDCRFWKRYPIYRTIPSNNGASFFALRKPGRAFWPSR